jgi:hypothetical protein
LERGLRLGHHRRLAYHCTESAVERVKTLCDVGVLDAKVLDGMFGPQFFWLVNDVWIQKRVLFEGDHFFPEIFALHQQLSAYRKRSGREVPSTACDLALKDPGRYERNLRLYREKHFRM